MQSTDHNDLEAFRGRITYRGAADYSNVVAGMQTGVKLSPDLIVEPLDSTDVQRAVAHAAHGRLPLLAKATGHGSRSVDNGMIIDTNRLNHIRIDPDQMMAEVGAGAMWRDVIVAAAEYGLVPLSGTAGTVGVVGYTLGGGMGPLSRQHGYAADHVIDLDIVTPDGTLRHVSPDSEPDLFWAVRGAGRYLGIVTAMRFRLFPIRQVYAGTLALNITNWRQAIEHYLEWTTDLPRQMSSSLSLMNFSNSPELPESIRGSKKVTIYVSYLGDSSEADPILRPLRQLPLAADTVALMPSAELASIFNDPMHPHAYQGEAVAAQAVNPAALDAELAYLSSPDISNPTFLFVHHLGGAMAAPATPANAVGHRQAQYLLRMISSPGPEFDPDTVAAEQDAVLGALASEPVGRMGNFLFGDNDIPAKVRSCYEPADFDRLIRIKREIDPQNLIRLSRGHIDEL